MLVYSLYSQNQALHPQPDHSQPTLPAAGLTSCSLMTQGWILPCNEPGNKGTEHRQHQTPLALRSSQAAASPMPEWLVWVPI